MNGRPHPLFLLLIATAWLGCDGPGGEAEAEEEAPAEDLLIDLGCPTDAKQFESANEDGEGLLLSCVSTSSYLREGKTLALQYSSGGIQIGMSHTGCFAGGATVWVADPVGAAPGPVGGPPGDACEDDEDSFCITGEPEHFSEELAAFLARPCP